jgi:hypothetical protein
VLVALAVLLPYSIALGTLWSNTGSDLTFVHREKQGTLALRPLIQLISVTADAQSAAVAGAQVDAAKVRTAIAAMNTANASVGDPLGISGRWTTLRSGLTDLLATAPRGAAAYGPFSQVIDLELALVTAVGDSSNLILDPRLDSYYAMDAALLRAPLILVEAGRAVDLALIDEGRKAAVRTQPLTAALALDHVTSAADALDASLRKSFAATSSRTLGPGLLTQVDGLQNALAQLNPPLSAVGAAAAVRSAADLQASRSPVRDSVLRLESALFDQLDTMLNDRAQDPDNTRRLVLLATLAGLLLAGAVAWVLAPRRVTEPEIDGDADAEAGTTTGAAGTDRTVPVDDTGRDGENLLEARELLEAHRLVRVGRAVTARERTPARRDDTIREPSSGQDAHRASNPAPERPQEHQ